MTRRFGLSVFALKLIACAAMLVDHFAGAIMLPEINEPWVSMWTYQFMRSYIGRIAFPIFAYLIAQGCLHTKNIGKYLLRLGILAIISEPFFDMAFWFWDGSIDFLNYTNIFYTLFLGAAAIAIYEKLRGLFAKDGEIPLYASAIAALPALPIMFAAYWLHTDYAHLGVSIIFLIYILGPKNPIGRAVALAIGMLALYMGNIDQLIGSFIAIGLIALYNGQLGPNNRAIQWAFYFFYPVHIAALLLIRTVWF